MSEPVPPDTYELRSEIAHLKERLTREELDHQAAVGSWESEREDLVWRAEQAEKRLRQALELSQELDLETNWRRNLRDLIGSLPRHAVSSSQPVCRRCSCCLKWSRTLSDLEKKNEQLRNEVHGYEIGLYRSATGVWDAEPFGSPPAGAEN